MHVDRKDLYTDIEARIRYLHSFVDFSSSMHSPARAHEDSSL